MKHGLQARSFQLIILYLLNLVLPGTARAQADSVAQRIILIGDAGQQEKDKQPELELARKLFPMDKKTTVLYLGDNVYPQGLPSVYADDYDKRRQVLDSQINLVRGTKARAYFIPGNHDWAQGRAGGYQQVTNQSNYIVSQNLENVQFIPFDVCPGPEEIPLSDKITLVAIDSQWWLHQFEKSGVTYGCDIQTEDELLDALKDIINRNEDKILIFATHHPFVSYGRHGGYYTIKQHIFPLTDLNPKLYIPLPVIGSLYPISRGIFGNIQDIRHPIYKNFSRSVDSILNQHPYCIRVSGHEHTLQLIKQSEKYYIVSGSGSKITPLAKGEDLVFGASQTGFSVIEIIKNGHVNVSFYSSMADSAMAPIFSAPLPSWDTTPRKPRIYEKKKFPDSVSVAANEQYAAGKFKKWLLGTNYRKEWITPIKVKVFDISNDKNGLKITRQGGGMQTKSLRLTDKKGNEYVLRSVEKFPDNTLPEEFRQTFIKDAVVDGISASYPYAALSIPVLSDAVKVPHSKPRLVYIPDDPQLGYYRNEFKNSLAIFEEKEPGGFEKNSSTEKVLDKLRDDNDNEIDQQAVLKARLLDMFIMDFDRHEDQWRWGTNDTGDRKTYYPIPRDRDQAFFINNGFIPKQVSKPYRLPKFQGFRPKAININTFNFNARYFDRSFLNELSREEWAAMADTVIQAMTDSVIEAALARQPKEIYKFSAPAIIETLKKRREYLKEEALEYFHFLARDVDITGSDKRELFLVQRNDDGSVNVEVHKIKKEGDTGRVLYSRKFFRNETREIRLYARGDDDSIVIKGGRGPIKVRIIGGRGKDFVVNESKAGKGKTIVYDFKPEGNVLKGEPVRNELSYRSSVNRYNRREFQYDHLVPGLSFAFNRDDGLYVGLGLRYIGHGFRKEPYKILQEVSAHHALATKAFMYSYKLELIDLIGKNDLLVNGNLRLPRNTINFFGFGNETDFDPSNGKNIAYYRTRFDHIDFNVLMRTKLTPDITVAYGPSFQYFHYKPTDNEGRIISETQLPGLDTMSLYQPKTYLGPKLRLTIDNRNDPVIPSRGVKWNTELEYFNGLSRSSSNFTRLNSDMSIYISSNTPAKMVIALRFGGGVNFGGNYEYYQAQYLSGTQNLRGYRKFRFAGDKMFYNNVDIRYKIADFRTYLFPGAFGLFVFHDVGRVWYKNERSNQWHTGYGGGLWLAPAKKLVATGFLAFSKEGVMPQASIGYQF